VELIPNHVNDSRVADKRNLRLEVSIAQKKKKQGGRKQGEEEKAAGILLTGGQGMHTDLERR